MGDFCIFCKIIGQEDRSNFVYEDDSVIVVNDINPQAPVHLLVFPKKHIRSVNDLSGKDKDLIAHIIMIGKEIAVQKKINLSGYKMLFNIEKGGGQVVFHLHLHIIGGWNKEKGLWRKF